MTGTATPILRGITDSARVVYQGSLEQYRGEEFTAIWCECDLPFGACSGYELSGSTTGAILRHVGLASVVPV
jgi:hypothetical protein